MKKWYNTRKCLTATAAVLCAAAASAADTFHLPFPAPDMLRAFTALHGGGAADAPDAPVKSVTTLAVSSDNTVLRIARAADGYATTEIWGDGDASNGCPPGQDFLSDRFWPGDVLTLSEDQLQGGDRIIASKPIAVSRAVWATGSGTRLVAAAEVLPDSRVGTSFVVPVGEDTPDQNEMFEYTGLSLVACARATVSVDTDADGAPDITRTLAEGESLLIDGGLLQGATVTATAPVQADLVTGDRCEGYEIRTFKLWPADRLGSAYLIPAGPATAKVGSKLWLHNDGDTQLLVGLEMAGATGVVPVPPRAAVCRDLTGAVRVSAARPFSALVTVDAAGRARSDAVSYGANRDYDWGYTPLPESELTPLALVSLGWGCEPDADGLFARNAAPVWITAAADTTVSVNGGAPVAVRRLESQKLTLPGNNQSGLRIVSADSTPIACAWGPDPATGLSAAPALDAGTAVLPLPTFTADVALTLETDADNNGRVSPGDTLRCTVTAAVTPGAAAGAFSCAVSADGASVVDGSFQANVAGDGWTCRLAVPAENAADAVTVTATVSAADDPRTAVAAAREPLLADIAGRVEHARADAAAAPMANITVRLVSADGEIERETVTDADGRYVFTDLPGGAYSVTAVRPALFDDASANPVPVTLAGGVNAEAAAVSLVAVPSRAGVALAVTPDTPDVPGGHTVTYTYHITNTGSCPLRNVTVVDEQLGPVAVLEGVLEPGTTAAVTKTSEPVFTDLETRATVTAEPSDAFGTDYGLAPVSAAAAASVHALPVPGKISGAVWFDVNKNGAFDADEAPAPGVTVKVFGADRTLLAEAVTDENGEYTIPECAPGSVTVKFIAPDGYKFANDTRTVDLASAATLGGLNQAMSVDPNARSLMLVVQALADFDGYDHTVWSGCEVNFNHVLQNTGKTYLKVTSLTDPGMAHLLGSENIPLPPDEMPNGVIAPGQRVIITHTYAITQGVECSARVTAVPCDAAGRPLSKNEYKGADSTGVSVVGSQGDLSYIGSGKRFPIGDFVWYDLNENGLQDDTDHLRNSTWPHKDGLTKIHESQSDEDPAVGAPGVRIRLWHKTKNGSLPRPDCEAHTNGWEIAAEVWTDENGHYGITDIPWGYYYMQYFLPEGFRFAEYHFKDGYAGLKQSYNNSDVSAFADDGTGWTDEMYLKLDAYYDKEVGLVCTGGVIHVEITPGDAAHGEPWIIRDPGDVVYHYTVTNPGMFNLTNVVVVDDRFDEVATFASLNTNEVQTFTWTGPVEVSGTLNNVTAVGTPIRNNKICGSEVNDTDVAEVLIIDKRPASLSGRVWADLDHDGEQDDGEDPVFGVRVVLRDAAGEPVRETRTDAAGRYVFTDVEPGDYSVLFVPGSSWEFTLKDAVDDARDSDADPATGASDLFTLKPATDDTVIDAGLVNGVLPGVCDYVWIADFYNAVIGGNLVTDGGDSEGRLLVVGNANLGAGYSVGLIGPGYGRTRDAATLGTDTLVVAGDLTEGSRPDINGNVVFGGAYHNDNDLYNGRVYEHRHVSPVTVSADGNVPEDGSGATMDEILADLKRFSDYAASLPDNAVAYVSETDETNAQYTAFTNWTWRGNATHRNVFTVTDDIWSLNSQGITLGVPADSKVLINVFSSRVEFNNASITLPKGMSPAQVVFNFPNAARIETAGFEFPGAVFAPKADADLTGASINGFAFFGGNVTTHTGFEFHDYAFKGFDCSGSPVVARRPALSLTLTAEGSAPGAIVRALQGAVVTFTQTVRNDSTNTARAVSLTDPLGRVIELGDLAPGETRVNTFAWAAAEDRVLTASVRAFGAADGPYAETAVSVQASATLKTYASAADLAAALTAAGPDAARRPRPDFVITSFTFINDAAPTITGQTFGVRIAVKNIGEVSAVPGRIGVYVDHPGPVAPGEAAAKSVLALKPMRPDEPEQVFEFTNLPTTDTAALHIRAFVDADGAVSELSEGNNQAALFVFLAQLNLHVSIGALEDGTPCVTLSWTAHAAQTYTVLESKTLGGGLDTFKPCERPDANGVPRVLSVPSAGEGVEMSVSVPMDGAGGFYTLRAESALDMR